MHKFLKLALAAVLAVVALSVGIGTAAALRSIGVSQSEVTTSGNLQFRGTEGTVAIRCEITLLRTIRSSIEKRRGAQIGRVTGVRVAKERCRNSFGGAARVLVLFCRLERPERPEVVQLCITNVEGTRWLLFYDSFTGTLPRIEGINKWIEGAAFLLDTTVLTIRQRCSYEGRAFGRINTEGGGTITGGEAVEATTILPLKETLVGSGTCEPEGTFSGTFSRPEPATRITLL